MRSSTDITVEARRAFPPLILWGNQKWLGSAYQILLGSRLRGVVFVCSLFSLYYLVTNMVACSFGVGLSVKMAQLLVSLGFPEIIMGFARTPVAVPAFGDPVHATFSISVIVAGGLFGVAYLHSAPTILSLLAFDSGLRPSRGQYDEVVAFVHSATSSVWFYLLPVVGVAAGVSSFQWLSHLAHLNQWWGNVSHGSAGTVLSLNIGFVIGVGILLGEVMVLITLALYRLFLSPMNLRPLHPDGCGGFTPLGVFSIVVYWIMLCGAVGFATVYFFGYFGLEDTALFWGCVLIYLVAVFAVVFAPLIWFAARVEKEKRRVLRQLEKNFQRRIGRDVCTLPSHSEIPAMEDLLALYAVYEKHPLTPFGGRTLLTLVGSYAIQVAAGLYGFFGP